MNFSYTEEQQDIIRTVRALVEKEIAPYAAEMDETEKLHDGLLEKLAAQGLLGVVIPEEYGGIGLDTVTIAALYEELGKGCAGVATTVAANALASYPVIIAGTAEQKKQYFDVINGERLAAFALTEPGTGSDAGSVSTRAIKTDDGSGYVLNGTKCFITNGALAEMFVVFANTRKTGGIRGLTAFIVRKGTPGFMIGKAENKMGIRASNTTELIFQDCFIPVEQRLGREGQGFRIAMNTLDAARPLVGAVSVGIAEAAFKACSEYAKVRVQFGKPIASFEMVQQMIADMAIEVEAARMMVQKACWMRDQGVDFSRQAAMAKCYASDVAMRVTTNAVQVMGGYGYMKDYPVEKYMRDAKIMQIYEGTNQIQRMVIANKTLY
ncbi:acyl-CoA dehydrogenase family protein [Megasphaera sp. UPII 135-E]|uniref:acyl-CoA dehydrogenase family protein n=1 Tax=Megasphaera sp. UPII 135-E TaxID=1000569 RepID=UPI00056D7B90|nr:acyl-CoA dehydrogenase family protein [Megasphaera sp. UPII 135-E]MUP59478.1 acyl-CoA dehydrogenase [Veillonellaceae bacterium M2-4]